MKQRFNVGDLVRLKYQPNYRLFILEVLTQTCYADTQQIFYYGRAFWSDAKQVSETGFELKQGINRDLTKFSEIEVEAIPESPYEKELLKLKKELVLKTQEKHKLIYKQDFEKAANARSEEKEIKKRIEVYSAD